MVSFLKNKNSVTLHYDGLTKVIAAGDARFEKILTAIREKRLNDIPEIADNELFFTRQGLKVQDGILQLDGEEMSTELSDRIMSYKENNLPIDSLLAFWNNLKLNPSFNSRKQLFRFLENKGHSLTPDGNFIGYRGVTEDFKDIHSKTFDNRPGSICQVPREMVDDNPDNTCSRGLHVGGYEYAKDFGRGGKLVLVKVNPKDVVAVPNDYNGQKMRVCRFEVIQEADAMIESVVFGDVKPLPPYQTDGEFETDDETEFTYTPQNPHLGSDFDKHMASELKKIDKKRYANNHAKRGPNGKFIAKKKKKTKFRGGSKKRA